MRCLALPVLLLVCVAATASGACLDDCNAERASCTPDCSELVGAARGACLRACTAEFNRCKVACSGPTPPASPPKPPSPKPPSPKRSPPVVRRSPSPKPSGPRDPACVNTCNSDRAGCSGDCGELINTARAQCLKQCASELNACLAACPPPPPPPPGSVLVELGWDKLKCFSDGESGSAEPYLWTVFFKIDTTNTDVVGGKLKVKPGASLVSLAGDGSHKNLPSFKSGDIKNVGPIFTFKPLLLPFTPFPGVKAAILGSVSVLMEEDSVSDDGARAGARAFRDELDKLLKGVVNNLSLSAGVMLPDLSTGITQVQKAVIAAIKDEQSFFENLGTILGSPDDFLGSQIVITAVADGVPGGIPGTTAIPISTTTTVAIDGNIMDAGSDGKWQLFGHVRRIQNN